MCVSSQTKPDLSLCPIKDNIHANSDVVIKLMCYILCQIAAFVAVQYVFPLLEQGILGFVQLPFQYKVPQSSQGYKQQIEFSTSKSLQLMETQPELMNISQAVLFLCIPIFAITTSLLNILIVTLVWQSCSVHLYPTPLCFITSDGLLLFHRARKCGLPAVIVSL